ncbi:MAG TPA: hypothetical protein VHO01_16730 [Jatrophihabitans sp.]|nr:hypothetical protein [Jatrophihabitans sp.]
MAATAAAAVLLLAACGAGQDAQTVNQRPPIDGASATAGDVSIRTAAIVSGSGGDSYAQGGSALLQLVIVNTGSQEVTLTGVSTSAAASTVLSSAGVPQGGSNSAAASGSSSPSDSSSASGSASPSTSGSPSGSASLSGSAPATSNSSGSAASASTPIKIAAGQSVQIGFSVVGPNILLQGLTAPLYPAQSVPVTFTFSTGSGAGAGSQTIQSDLPVQLSSNPPSAPVISDATQPVENGN